MIYDRYGNVPLHVARVNISNKCQWCRGRAHEWIHHQRQTPPPLVLRLSQITYVNQHPKEQKSFSCEFPLILHEKSISIGANKNNWQCRKWRWGILQYFEECMKQRPKNAGKAVCLLFCVVFRLSTELRKKVLNYALGRVLTWAVKPRSVISSFFLFKW